MSTPHSFVGLDQVLSIGTTLSPNDLAPIEEIKDVEYSGSKTDLHDSSHSGSTAHTYINGLRDIGEMSFTANWLPGATEQEVLRALQGEVVLFTHELPDSLGTISGEGVLQSLDYSSSMEKTAELKGKIKVSGDLSFS
jgi:hypothetical protein